MASHAKQWIMVRVDRITHLLLGRVKQRLERETPNNRIVEGGEVERWGLSLDSVIRELIRRDEAHQARSRRAAAKRRSRRADADPETYPDPDPETYPE
jgi:hypothetical protein